MTEKDAIRLCKWERGMLRSTHGLAVQHTVWRIRNNQELKGHMKT